MKKILLLPAFGLLALSVQAQIATHVVISEIYGGGGNSGATYTHDFIELYNPTATPVTLTGWSVQYTSSAGTSWTKTDLTGTIPAKGFYLIREAQGAGGTTALPTPDAIGSLAMSATAGKVALVNNGTLLSGACPTGAQIIDFAGFGGANCSEGSSPIATLSNTTSAERKASDTSTVTTMSTGGSEVAAGNGYDANVNGTDFIVRAPDPQNSSVIENGVVPDAVSAAVGISPAEPATNGSFIITLNNAAPAGGVTITYTVTGTATAGTDYTALSGTITIPEAATTGTVNVDIIDDTLSEGNETIILTLQSATAGYTVSTTAATATISDNEVTITRISTIQGSGTTATSGTFTAEAIVTGVYPGLSPAGFYMQEEDADADADPATSEGIFVVTSDVVAVGDRVRVTGTVQENASTPSFGQAVFASATVTVVNNGITLPAATTITLPVTALTDFERYEGMLVQFPATLTVTNNYTLGRYGEVGLSAGGLVYQPTQVIDVNDATPSGTSSSGTSNLTEINNLVTSNALRSILLDDGTNTTVALPYADPVDHTLRLGSTVTNLTGIMGYAFGLYRIQPVPAAMPVFSYASRPTLPTFPGSNVKVASFNVLNYFNGDGLGGGFPTERGAHSMAEFTRQRDKIINAIATIDADVVGLLEIENDGTGPNSAIQNLVNGLNAAMGTNTYSFINDGATSQTFGTDAIRCGILYKSTTVTPNGTPMLSASDSFNRPPLAQKFTLNTVGVPFNFVINHYKSKGCTGAAGTDLDQLDGQSCFNNRRKLQSIALLNFFNNTVIPTSGTDRIISVGDYNSYYEEDPLDILRAANYNVLSTSSSHSYQFDGQIGSLDHAVVSNTMNSNVTGVAKWNINADEPVYLDYNDLINDGSGDFENPFAAYYTTAPYRSSDHDPVIIGLNLAVPLPLTLTGFDAVKQQQTTILSWSTASGGNYKSFVVERADQHNNWKTIATVAANTTEQYTATDETPFAGMNLYRLKIMDQEGEVTYSPIRQVNFDASSTFRIYPNPSRDQLYISSDNASGNTGIYITNVLNQVVLKSEMRGGYGVLQIASLPEGIYNIRLTLEDNEVMVKRFIKR